MSRAFVKDLPNGTRRGNTKGLRRCEREGWTLLGSAYCSVRYEPRAKNDPRPWWDGVRRYRALDCWAVPPIVTETLAVIGNRE
ncbi:hypothetical protein [Kitasatospora aureofaciens]|uniref:hypothetical protein n=1 Tax=Kitasatospora aureofaciens TaxID=1894 RepID=UPI001C466DC9|nr:hypothetical protein [Kitasatospora aureofaciens]MBV6703413.1 hypothetical protein [Kitasatospora aureofaciens]